MNDNKDKHRETFKEEARELLAELEASLLELEERPDDADLIGRVFRAMHTIKGSGAMFGFEAISAFTHEVETAFDLVRNGSLSVTKELIDLTLACRDHIRLMLEADDRPLAEDEAKAASIIASLRDLIPAAPLTGGGQGTAKHSPAAVPSSDAAAITCRVHFRPPQNIACRGLDPVDLLNELRRLGDCTIAARMQDIPALDDLHAEACYTSWDIIVTTSNGLDRVTDVFLFVQDDSELTIGLIDDADKAGEKKLGDILLERGDVSPEVVQKALSAQKRIGQVLVEMGAVDAEKVTSALAEQQHLKAAQEKKQAAEASSSIRVSSGKLDSLVNLVGELVTVQARLNQSSSRQKDPEMLAIAEEVERLTSELREQTMSMRMLPIGTTFSKFKRLVRDLCRDLDKEIELATEGAETELDKSLIEKLNDPLIHLIRNSADHGIEAPVARTAAGKPRQGTIHLSAIHSGAHVFITIKDDGAGLDADAIRIKAVERGLVSPETTLSEKDLFALIFAPGFSTAKTVTNVSGRGVGMDVVKQAIDAFGGSIDISSRKGAGTTITLKLPLTLAIIEGLLVRIAEEYFVLPVSSVEGCVELTRNDQERMHGKCMVSIRGHLVPYIRLREYFNVGGAAPDVEQIVITDMNGKRVGFTVDSVIGEYQTVIKNLGRFYRDIEGISGATILGDGRVALILDVSRLVALAEREEAPLRGNVEKEKLHYV